MHVIRRCDHMTEGEEGILSANTGGGENVFVSDVHYTTPRSARVAHIAAKIGRLHTKMIFMPTILMATKKAITLEVSKLVGLADE